MCTSESYRACSAYCSAFLPVSVPTFCTHQSTTGLLFSSNAFVSSLVRYIESIVYRAVVENVACEMSARMIAMKSASDNAGNLIDDLQLVYNKARQASITPGRK